MAKYIAKPYVIEAEEITKTDDEHFGDYIVHESGKLDRVVAKGEFTRKYVIAHNSPHSAGA